jgi:hypothetical protein
MPHAQLASAPLRRDDVRHLLGRHGGDIGLDGKRQRENARAAGSVDFLDRSPLPYMLLGVLCGPLPLIFHFGTTRKSVGGWLLGLAIGIGWSVLVSVVFNVGMALLTPMLRS